MPKKEMEFFDVGRIPWKRVVGVVGVKEKVLSRDPESGSYTRILKLERGAEIPQLLQHDFWEEVYIIKGSLTDKRKKRTFTKGMYACRPPGMKHGPYVSKSGFLGVEMRYYPERYQRYLQTARHNSAKRD